MEYAFGYIIFGFVLGVLVCTIVESLKEEEEIIELSSFDKELFDQEKQRQQEFMKKVENIRL